MVHFTRYNNEKSVPSLYNVCDMNIYHVYGAKKYHIHNFTIKIKPHFERMGIFASTLLIVINKNLSAIGVAINREKIQ